MTKALSLRWRFCYRYVGSAEQSGMVVLEVDIPSGYAVSDKALQKFVKDNRDTVPIRNGEVFNGRAVFYFEYVSGFCLLFCGKIL